MAINLRCRSAFTEPCSSSGRQGPRRDSPVLGTWYSVLGPVEAHQLRLGEHVAPHDPLQVVPTGARR